MLPNETVATEGGGLIKLPEGVTPQLNKALAAAQGEFPDFERESTGHYGKYLSLPAIYRVVLPILSKHGLSLSHRFDDGLYVVSLRHSSGEYIESSIPLGEARQWQQFGAAKTYAERYAVSGLLAISGDEDLESSSDITTQERPQHQPARQSAPTRQPAAPQSQPQMQASGEGIIASLTALSFRQSEDPKKPQATAICKQEAAGEVRVNLFNNHCKYVARGMLIPEDAFMNWLEQSGSYNLNPGLRVRLTTSKDGRYYNLVADEDLLTLSNPFSAKRFETRYPDRNVPAHMTIAAALADIAAASQVEI